MLNYNTLSYDLRLRLKNLSINELLNCWEDAQAIDELLLFTNSDFHPIPHPKEFERLVLQELQYRRSTSKSAYIRI